MLVEVTSRVRTCRQVKLMNPEEVKCGDKAGLLVSEQPGYDHPSKWQI